MNIILQAQWLFLLAIPVATISWTITHEEIFKEAKEFCVRHNKESRYLLVRKFFYLFTCEYCFSHYVAALAIVTTGFKLLMPGWTGYIIAGFAIVWVANIYMGIYQVIRLTIKKTQLHNEAMDKEIEQKVDVDKKAINEKK